MNSEYNNQPKKTEIPLEFTCSICKNLTSTSTTIEERKEGFVEGTGILVNYIEDLQVYEGNWIEIIEGDKSGLKISFCPCSHDYKNGEVVDYMLKEPGKEGILYKSRVLLNSNIRNVKWRVENVKAPK